MKITLLVHAESKYDSKGLIQGHDNSKLSRKGVIDCGQLKDELLKYNYDICYMSPLLRSVETAIRLIGDRVLTSVDYRIIERDYNSLVGSEEENINFYDHNIEDIVLVKNRCEDFIKDILNSKYESILIISHKLIINILSSLLNNEDIDFDKKLNNLELIEINIKKND